MTMNKDAMQFILMNAGKVPIGNISKTVRLSVKTIRRFMRDNGIAPYKPPQIKQNLIARQTRDATNAIKFENNREYELNSWPVPNTDIKTALRGRTYGGDTSAPGTKKPINMRAINNSNNAVFKSSMG